MTNSTNSTLDHARRTIELLRDEIAEEERRIADKKKGVNGLCQAMGQPALYQESELSPAAPLREDEFYGLSLPQAIAAVLNWRRSAGQGSACVQDILDTLVRGGFRFRSNNADNQKRNLYTVLRENDCFHKLPRGNYGLTAWYPSAAKMKDQPTDDAQAGAEEGAAAA